jgi:hypothetical protein
MPLETGEASARRRRDRLQIAGEWLTCGGSVLVFGPPNVGKSTAIELLAATSPRRVLRYTATGPGTGPGTDPGTEGLGTGTAVTYSALRALLSAVTSTELGTLPHRQRAALTALDDVELPTIRTATLNLLRTMSLTTPVLLLVDDVQDLDEGSSAVLAFIAQRVEDVPVTTLSAERVVAGQLPAHRHLSASPLLVVRLGEVMPAGIRNRVSGAWTDQTGSGPHR